MSKHMTTNYIFQKSSLFFSIPLKQHKTNFYFTLGMIGFKGRCQFVQYMKDKPTKR